MPSWRASSLKLRRRLNWSIRPPTCSTAWSRVRCACSAKAFASSTNPIGSPFSFFMSYMRRDVSPDVKVRLSMQYPLHARRTLPATARRRLPCTPSRREDRRRPCGALSLSSGLSGRGGRLDQRQPRSREPGNARPSATQHRGQQGIRSRSRGGAVRLGLGRLHLDAVLDGDQPAAIHVEAAAVAGKVKLQQAAPPADKGGAAAAEALEPGGRPLAEGEADAGFGGDQRT